MEKRGKGKGRKPKSSPVRGTRPSAGTGMHIGWWCCASVDTEDVLTCSKSFRAAGRISTSTKKHVAHPFLPPPNREPGCLLAFEVIWLPFSSP